MRTLLAAVAALTLALPAAAQAPAAAPAPMLREGVTQKVSEHVWVIPDGGVGAVPNVGIVVGTTAVLVVDTGMGARNGEIVMREAAKVAGGKPMFLVTTHIHPEHDLGAHAFPATTRMIRSRDQDREIAEVGTRTAEAFSSRSPAIAELLRGAAYRKADVSFDREHALDLGGVRVRLLAMGANHTLGDTAIFVEGDGVLFAGDIIMTGRQPGLGSPHSKVSQWLASLDRLEALRPRLIVPSHGPTGDTAMIVAYRGYLAAIRDQAALAKRQGQSVDQAVQAVAASMGSRYPDQARLANAVRIAYAEAP